MSTPKHASIIDIGEPFGGKCILRFTVEGKLHEVALGFYQLLLLLSLVHVSVKQMMEEYPECAADIPMGLADRIYLVANEVPVT